MWSEMQIRNGKKLPNFSRKSSGLKLVICSYAKMRESFHTTRHAAPHSTYLGFLISILEVDDLHWSVFIIFKAYTRNVERVSKSIVYVYHAAYRQYVSVFTVECGTNNRPLKIWKYHFNLALTTFLTFPLTTFLSENFLKVSFNFGDFPINAGWLGIQVFK